MPVGSSEGALLGPPEGDIEGASLGSKVGRSDGGAEGVELGFSTLRSVTGGVVGLLVSPQ